MGIWPAAMIEMAVRKRHPSIPADWANAMALTIKGGLQIAVLRTKKSSRGTEQTADGRYKAL